jgi:predicted RecB family nuclease
LKKNGNKKLLQICKNGHEFYKSSNCPGFPICEEERKPKGNFLSLLSASARRALERVGITNLEILSTYSEKEILNLHGMGKSTIPKLYDLLTKSRAFI